MLRASWSSCCSSWSTAVWLVLGHPYGLLNSAPTNCSTRSTTAARAVILARIALGSQGIRVAPADWPTPSSAEGRKLLRDALRLTLWRVNGSTGAWLVPDALARKRADCGV